MLVTSMATPVTAGKIANFAADMGKVDGPIVTEEKVTKNQRPLRVGDEVALKKDLTLPDPSMAKGVINMQEGSSVFTVKEITEAAVLLARETAIYPLPSSLKGDNPNPPIVVGEKRYLVRRATVAGSNKYPNAVLFDEYFELV